MARLKVYVTPIGFHDAYVAATSQKAALAAWGADVDLFARGAASVVTDKDLAAEPLASPGTVIRRLRGTAAEQIAALGKATGPARPRGGARPVADRDRATAKAKPKGKPRPSRKKLDTAEATLAVAQARYAARHKAIVDRIADLQRERQRLRMAEEKEIARLERQRDAARTRYQEAVARWTAD